MRCELFKFVFHLSINFFFFLFFISVPTITGSGVACEFVSVIEVIGSRTVR